MSSERLKVFVSYSRKDSDFADRLVAALAVRSFEAYLDKKDILPGEPWQERLSALIAGADTVIFLISPDAVESPVCDWEVNEAERLGKRILPVVWRHVVDEKVPGRLHRLNYILLTSAHDFTTEFEKLVRALLTDIDWIREHTRLGELARRWAGSGKRSEHSLLRGQDVNDAELWISSRPREAPEPTELHREFMQESRRVEHSRAQREREQLVRTRRFQRRAGWALAAVTVLVAGGLVAAIVQDREAGKREARVLTSLAGRAVGNHHYDRAMRIALQGLPPRGSFPWAFRSGELEATLAGAAMLSRHKNRLEHGSLFLRAVFSPDGRRLITVSDDKSPRLWDTLTGAEIATLRGHESRISNTAFSFDGNRIVTAATDKTARVWDAESGAELSVLRGHGDNGRPASLLSASFSPDGTRIVTASTDHTARLWDSKTGAQIAVLQGHTGTVHRASFSPDGKRVVTASSDKTAGLWDLASESGVVLKGHLADVMAAHFSPDGTRIVTASADKTARLWDGTTGSEIAVLVGHEGSVVAADFSPDGARVVTASADNSARTWDGSRGSPLSILRGHNGPLRTAAFRPNDGARIITGSDDKTARLWDAETGAELAVLSGHESTVGAAFGPDGRVAVTASDDGTARIWDVSNGLLIADLKGHTGLVRTAAFSADGTRILTTSHDFTARIWNGSDGSAVTSWGGPGFKVASAAFVSDGFRIVVIDPSANMLEIRDGTTGAVISVITASWVQTAAFSADGTKLVTKSGLPNTVVHVWEVASGKEIAVLGDQRGYVESAVMSPDATKVVTTSRDGITRLWEVASGREIAALKGHSGKVHQATFSPDSRHIVTVSGVLGDRTARLWDATNGTERFVMRGHEAGVIGASFSPDGMRVVTTSLDRTGMVWHVGHGARLAVLKGREQALGAPVFSPDGKHIGTLSGDKTARLWDAASGIEIAVLRGRDIGGPGTHAVFSPDGKRLVTISGNTAWLWDVSWVTQYQGSELDAKVCREKLFRAQKLTISDADDPVLFGLEGVNVCERRGPLSLDYWTRLAKDAWTSSTARASNLLTKLGASSSR